MDLEPKILHWSCALFGIYVQQSKEYSHIVLEKGLHVWQLFLFSYPFLIFFFIIVNFVYAIWNVNFGKDFLVSWLVATLVHGSQVTTHAVIILETQAKMAEHEEFLSKIYDIVSMFKLRLRQDFCDECFTRKLQRIFIGLALFSIVNFILFAILVTLLQDAGYFWHSLLSIVTMRLRFLQLFIYIQILEKFIETLNQKLQQIVLAVSRSEMQLLDIDSRHLISFECLLAAKQIYAEITDCFYKYNSFGGWSLFAIVSCYFLDFTCHFYWLFLALDSLLPFLYTFSALSNLIPLCFLVCWFCHTCQQCKLQSRLTSNYVQKLIDYDGSYRFSKPYCNLVKDFSFQLQLCKLKVSAREFYEFDKELIMSIFAAIATHLVILIQFLTDDQYTDNIFTK